MCAMKKSSSLGVLVAVVLAGSIQPALAGSEAGAEQCPLIESPSLPGKAHYASALREWEQGQTAQALASLEKAAYWGDTGAQGMLGLIHFNGERVPQDHVLGLAWLTVAAQQGQDLPLSLLSTAQAVASEAEREQAQALVPAQLAAYQFSVTAKRASNRLERSQRETVGVWHEYPCLASNPQRLRVVPQTAARVDTRMAARYLPDTR
jgi:hypothetical protein